MKPSVITPNKPRWLVSYVVESKDTYGRATIHEYENRISSKTPEEWVEDFERRNKRGDEWKLTLLWAHDLTGTYSTKEKNEMRLKRGRKGSV